ncbi:MAG TPA: GNAT family N-acyltransferase [Terriglobales bacterium]|nr:GNAT family N-acyltransferase [Terriglobales bacterium]
MRLKTPVPGNDFWTSLQLGTSLKSPVNPVLERIFSLDKLRELYQSVFVADGENIFHRVLKKMNVECLARAKDLARVPTSGPVVAVANHPFGILDGVLLGALLLKVRPDLKILTNYLLTGIPELDQYCIPLDPFGTGAISDTAGSVNQRGLRGAVDWLRSSGALLIFPAGEVAHFQWTRGVADPAWSTTAIRLARGSNAPLVPIFIDGRNSLPFHLVGFIHPRLRTARLPKEFLQKQGSQIEIRIGKPVCGDSVRASSAREATEVLRWKTYILANRVAKEPEKVKLPKLFVSAPQEPLAQPISNDALAIEIANLPAACCVESNEEYDAYCASPSQLPLVLQEIGRLRELSFREVGEGTGRAVDLDRFDDHYRHLFLWNREQQEIVGAYRLANTSEILPRFGVKGLYTNTLFRFKPEFFDGLGPALELGRSFVRPEYQRQYAPLLLLWKAIGRYVVLHPESPVLFGAVSISNSYAPASRTFMYQFFQSQFARHPLSSMVKPRHPFRSSRLKYWDIRAFHKLVRDSEELSGSVSEFEFDGKGLPVLLRQYLKVGGQVLAFNVDGNFSDVLDGLIVVDLRNTDMKSLQRYLGYEGAATFLGKHRTQA